VGWIKMHRDRTLRDGGASTDVIGPPPGELFSETNDNSVAILLTFGTAFTDGNGILCTVRTDCVVHYFSFPEKRAFTKWSVRDRTA
jgi:hypothetical protein